MMNTATDFECRATLNVPGGPSAHIVFIYLTIDTNAVYKGVRETLNCPVDQIKMISTMITLINLAW